MSTRRNLRSGSQAAGSGASPTPTNTGDIPATPGGRRTSRRAGNQPLPAIGLRTSTAYGSNSIAVPPRAATAQPNVDVANALQGLMQPSTRPAATSSRARPTSRGNTRTPTIRSALRNSQTPGGQSNAAASTPERSFNQEEDIFGRAGIESSPHDDNDLSNILEEPEDIDSDDDDIPIPDPNQVQMEQLREIARQNIDRAVAARDAATMGIEPPHVKAARFARRVRDFVVNFFQDPPWWAWRIILPVVITLLLATTVPYVSKIIPIGNPLSRIPNFYAPQDAVEIRDSLRHVESDIMQIKKQIERVNFDTVRELQKMLPDLVSVKRKKGGKVEIPKEIWEAIHAKIQSDDSLTSEPSSGKVSSGSGLSKKEVNKIFEAKWKSFLDENEGKVGKMMDSDFTSRFPKMLEENDVVRRADIIDMINDSWKDNSAKLTNEMEHLSKKFERLNREVTKVQQGSSKMSKDELKALAAEVSKLMPSTQLKATAKHNLEMSFNHGAQGANHFNINLGAAIQPEFTSPTWVPTEMPLFPMRIVHTLLHNTPPIQHGPIAALRRWEECGDCWCAATTDKKGSPLSLHVLLGASIWPEQIIVEHLPTDESYESGSVPKDMELLAYIPDFKQLDAVREYSSSIFKDGDGHSKIPAQYVKIGTWQYDAEIPQNVQPFRIQVNLKDLGVHTNKVIVRSKNNWGGEKVPYTCLYRVRLHGGIAARTPLA